jgi:formate-dependent nitrite reductase cytochrome c552 subunit
MNTGHLQSERAERQAGLISDAIADQLSDAEHAERQAADGPYYMDGPRKGSRVLCSTPEQIAAAQTELLAYAAQCRTTAERMRGATRVDGNGWPQQ